MAHPTARRLDQGQPLRDAMANRGMTLMQLADRTGVSYQLLGFLTSHGRHGRETTKPRTAALIEEALGVPFGSLFSVEVVYAKSDPQPAWDAL